MNDRNQYCLGSTFVFGNYVKFDNFWTFLHLYTLAKRKKNLNLCLFRFLCTGCGWSSQINTKLLIIDIINLWLFDLALLTPPLLSIWFYYVIVDTVIDRYEHKLQDFGTHHTEIQKQKKVENSFSGMLWYHREEKG